MADQAKGLTVKRIAKWLRNDAAGIYTDVGPGGVKGLRLVVKSRSNASWILRFQIDHRPRYMGLGSANTFNLDEARKRALEARKLLADGVDPLATKHAQRAAVRVAIAKAPLTFRECAERYLAANGDEWRNAKHREQWASSLTTYVDPIVGDLPVDQIDTKLILKVFEQPVDADPKRGLPGGTFWNSRRNSAMRVRGRVERILAWATVPGYRTGDNPARWQGHLSEVLAHDKKKAAAQVEHHSALAYKQMPTFMAELRTREGVAARALEFLILTAARTGEVRGARWSEIDFDAATWTVPAERMKGGIEHKVPLTPTAIALLKNLPTEDGNPHIFVGQQEGAGLAATALTDTLKRLKRGGITVHGFRSTFSTWAAERTNFPREVAEQAMAHVIADAVERAYKRTTLFDKRRRLMEQWTKFCSSPGAPVQQKSDNVVPITGVR